LLKFYNFFNASFDSFNYKREKPVEVAIESGHLEAALYLMENMKDVFEDQVGMLENCIQL
jgi:hypothetical protein